ncbi:hypothetical protein [Rubellicoccus peritrichatus]|uniref:Uncharacterized protein n=1 Tax=Rubellicoccus peritrichatus TaxID=3080537 RepID=A0AAQ3QV31_9BACT|nr:hypothetical protein [Puniceicoccus sp. CR14]WOO40368.1 hypothetical protein RZN69_17250 [Puniceicoccus sp. CR14]WOO40417.1 hypothetical protein RZN69_17495 [Puniceicoccus sp. CR14]WOO40466.1 hypothetical protein RZN69_17740 [Puniceicoccus sp. CR14]WOO40515.1 hypothetical protein RZN69_17985 [Puniceicoccus sp. CR14]
MLALLATFIASVGSAGIGSILKIIAGLIDSYAARGEAREKREALRDAKKNAHNIEFAKLLYGDGETLHIFSRWTRRIVALIGVSTLAVLGILALLWPTAPIVTFYPPEQQQSFSLLWGLLTIPIRAGETVTVSSGHIALMVVSIFSMIVGFYFTPGGRK